MKSKKVIAFVLLFIIVAGAAGAYWYKQQYQRLLAATTKGLVIGNAFGKAMSQTSCTEALKIKYPSCDTVECELSATGFIAGCMETAQKDNFCSGLPNVKDTRQSLSWVEKTCNENQPGNSRCRKYMHKFVSLCTEQTENRKMTTAEHAQSGFQRGFEQQSAQQRNTPDKDQK